MAGKGRAVSPQTGWVFTTQVGPRLLFPVEEARPM